MSDDDYKITTLPVPPVAVLTRKSSKVFAYASSFLNRFTNELDTIFVYKLIMVCEGVSNKKQKKLKECAEKSKE